METTQPTSNKQYKYLNMEILEKAIYGFGDKSIKMSKGIMEQLEPEIQNTQRPDIEYEEVVNKFYPMDDIYYRYNNKTDMWIISNTESGDDRVFMYDANIYKLSYAIELAKKQNILNHD